MVSCLDVSRYFIVKSYEDGREAQMTNMKVQKLLYYSQSLHLALYDQPLFDEEIQAWRYGPVCPPAYSFYSNFEAKQLPIPSKEFLAEIHNDAVTLLEEVWEYFGEHHAYLLSDMTHLEFPWKKARRGLHPYASSTEAILLEDMKELGKQKLRAIEREHPAYDLVMAEILKDGDSSQSSPRIGKGEVRGWLTSLLD